MSVEELIRSMGERAEEERESVGEAIEQRRRRVGEYCRCCNYAILSAVECESHINLRERGVGARDAALSKSHSGQKEEEEKEENERDGRNPVDFRCKHAKGIGYKQGQHSMCSSCRVCKGGNG